MRKDAFYYTKSCLHKENNMGSDKMYWIREAAKKVIFLVAEPLRGGGGGLNGGATKEKRTTFLM